MARTGMRWAAVAVAVTAMLPLQAKADSSSAALAGADRATINWVALPYFSPYYNKMDVATTGGWDGARLIVEQTDATDANLPDSGKSGDDAKVVWGTECTKAAQTITLTRKVFLPDDPAELHLAIRLMSWSNPAYKVNSARVMINGELLRETTADIADLTIGKERRSLFKYGANEIVIKARKPATPTACNKKSDPTTWLGVAVQLWGTFRSDFKVVDTTPSGSGSASTFTVTNLGPSSFPEGTPNINPSFGFWVPDPQTFIALWNAGRFNAGCVKSVTGGNQQLYCPITGLRVGQSVDITVTWGAHPNVPKPYNFVVRSSWSGYGWGDINAANGQGSRNVRLCSSTPCPPPT